MADAVGERVRTGLDLEAPETFELAGGRVALFTAGAPDKPSGNEDAVAAIPVGADRALLVVADGMGGAPSGARAAAEAIDAVARRARAEDGDDASLRSAVIDAFENANQRVLALGVGAGTTLCVAEVGPEGLRVCHVGDSAALLVGQRGKLKLQTIAHSPVGYAVESGLLDEAEALHHDDRHVVSNVIGARDMRIDVGSRRALALRDTLLLASDGLLDNVALDEIVESVRCGPIERAAEQLVTLGRQRMQSPADGEPSKPDDLSLVLYRRSEQG